MEKKRRDREDHLRRWKPRSVTRLAEGEGGPAAEIAGGGRQLGGSMAKSTALLFSWVRAAWWGLFIGATAIDLPRLGGDARGRLRTRSAMAWRAARTRRWGGRGR
jgi:hypothetical protein